MGGTRMTLLDPGFFSLGMAARHLGCHVWQIRRLFERDLLPPAPRIGPYRVIAAADLPRVEAALRQAGYLSAQITENGGKQ